MKVICMAGSNCDYDLYEKEFEVKDSDTGKCPCCGSTEIAPAWIKQYKVPGKEELRQNIIKTKERIKHYQERISELKKLKE